MLVIVAFLLDGPLKDFVVFEASCVRVFNTILVVLKSGELIQVAVGVVVVDIEFTCCLLVGDVQLTELNISVVVTVGQNSGNVLHRNYCLFVATLMESYKEILVYNMVIKVLMWIFFAIFMSLYAGLNFFNKPRSKIRHVIMLIVF